MNEYFNELAFSIIERAVCDYKFFKTYGLKEAVVEDDNKIFKREIEDFFCSEWCDFLLQNMNLTGEDILRYLNRE